MDLLLATRNANKVREIRSVFQSPDLTLHSALEFAHLPDVEENGRTLQDNAVKKARTLAIHSGWWALADDTGLEVEALHGAPGVHSARYAGPDARDEENVAKLLAQLEGVAVRRARFRTVLALADPAGHSAWVDGTCDGEITHAPAGHHGFGYDPVFRPNGSAETFAEMPLEEKNRRSHRGRALRSAASTWLGLLAANPDQLPEHARRR